MKNFTAIFILFFLSSCGPSRSAYDTQKALDVYTQSFGTVPLTELTAQESHIPLVIFNYRLHSEASPVSGIRQLEIFNSGTMKYWIHLRTTGVKDFQSVSFPGPSAAIQSEVDLLVRVITRDGVWDYHNQTLNNLFSRFDGEFIPDFGGNPEIILRKIPANTEIEYTLNQKFARIPFFISLHLPEARYRGLSINIDSGNETTSGILLTTIPFDLENLSKSNLLSAFFVVEKVVPEETVLLPVKSRLTLPSGELTRQNTIRLYFSIGQHFKSLPDDSKAGAENFYRNFLLPSLGFSPTVTKELLSDFRSVAGLDSRYFTALNQLDRKQGLDSLQKSILSVKEWSNYYSDLWSPWFNQFWPSVPRLAVALAWANQEKIKNLSVKADWKNNRITDFYPVFLNSFPTDSTIFLPVTDRPIK